MTSCQHKFKLKLLLTKPVVLTMKTLSIGDLKTHFSEVLDQVKQGETFIVCYGRKKKKVAALIPYEQLPSNKTRPLGLLEDSAHCYFDDDFKISDSELLNS